MCIRDSPHHCFVKDTFDPEISATIGIDFMLRRVPVQHPTTGAADEIVVRLWDTAGQERFRTLTSSFYRAAHGVVLVYNVTDPSSFDNIEKWLTEAKGFVDEDCVMMLIGNKTDLLDERGGGACVPNEEGVALAKKHKMMFAICSAKTKEGVVHSFEEVGRKVYDRMVKSQQRNDNSNATASGGVSLGGANQQHHGGGGGGGTCC
eukprot:TRINITY_DN8419_c0_g1_i1.p1 TRINITY_DN8419_c0_g1~~TRINITY_DN8419_c0_g1_i1.p1  ORF type:complete len:205 (-),score=79.72 TRINITY_DN8419_c0_g1_i1:290-904(-)